MSSRVNIYMTEDEREKLQAIAKKSGLSQSKIFRIFVSNFAMFERAVNDLVNEEHKNDNKHKGRKQSGTDGSCVSV